MNINNKIFDASEKYERITIETRRLISNANIKSWNIDQIKWKLKKRDRPRNRCDQQFGGRNGGKNEFYKNIPKKMKSPTSHIVWVCLLVIMISLFLFHQYTFAWFYLVMSVPSFSFSISVSHWWNQSIDFIAKPILFNWIKKELQWPSKQKHLHYMAPIWTIWIVFSAIFNFYGLIREGIST